MPDLTFNSSAPAGITLVTFSAGTPTLTQSIINDGSTNTPVLLSSTRAFKPLSVTVEVEGETYAQVEQRISDLFASLTNNSVEICLLESLYYTAVLTGVSDPAYLYEGLSEITLSFIATQHLPEVSTTLTGSGAITAAGNSRADAVITFTSPADGTASVCGITFEDLTPGSLVVVNGRNKTVTENGENIWLKTNMVSFPTVSPGENIINVMPSGLAVTIQYFPALT